HLVLIEEPEVHLHTQVQQVFILQAYKILRNHDQLGAGSNFVTQMFVSTHSSHIAHECHFDSLRYFRRTMLE
ncbi:AAA family ATPase, partial [Rhizobium ruizarguesonis]